VTEPSRAELVTVAYASLAAEILDSPAEAELVDEVVHEAELVDSPAGEVLDAELVDEQVHTSGLVVADESAEEQIYDAWMVAQKSRNTRDAYTRNYTEWCDFLDELGVPVLQARTEHVDRWQRHLEQAPNARTGKPLAAASIAQRVSTISAYYTHGRRMGLLPANPAEFAGRPTIDPDYSSARELTEDEAQRFIAAAFELVGETPTADRRRVAERDAEIVSLLTCTGVRVSEALNARVEDVGYDYGHRVLEVTRKGGRRDAVVLGACARQIDRRIDGRTSGPLYLTRSGKPVLRCWVYAAIRRIAAAADIPNPHTIGPHTLRHAFATLALDLGAELYDVQIAVGHADPRTTQKYDRRRRRRPDRSPVHKVAPLLLDQQDQRGRLF